MALNEKQKAFAEYYAACFNAAEAARKAGYSERTARTIGQQLLTKLDVQDYLRELRATAHNDRIATINEVLEYLTDTMRDENEQRKERTKAAQLLREALRDRTEPDEEGSITEIMIVPVDASGGGDETAD